VSPGALLASAGGKTLAELSALEAVLDAGAPWLDTRVLRTVVLEDGTSFPLYATLLGNPDPGLPIIGYFGGVHGLERIGSQVVTAFLQNLVARLAWDHSLHQQLQQVRLLFVPIVNPGGMHLGRRANPNGVDLMRNAPVEAASPVPWMLGGHRHSPRLPWYRGAAGAAMEAESAAVCDIVAQEMLPRSFAMAVDCHSGFGINDRIWFPYAKSRVPMEHLPEMHALKSLFEQANAHSRYTFEPQCLQYLTHGDLWDHLYARANAAGTCTFLPITLEMGSWLWVKKNPRQLFSLHGIFNPLIGHRQRRVLRQHQMLLEFLSRATTSHSHWLPRGQHRAQHHAMAMQTWFQ